MLPDPALYRVLVFAPLFLVEFTTLALLSLSPLVRLCRAAFFAFALMLLIFAVWALFGLGYPSAPLPFAFNAGSKVVAFVVALSLFLPQRGQASTPESAPAAADGSPVPRTRLTPPGIMLRSDLNSHGRYRTLPRNTARPSKHEASDDIHRRDQVLKPNPPGGCSLRPHLGRDRLPNR